MSYAITPSYSMCSQSTEQSLQPVVSLNYLKLFFETFILSYYLIIIFYHHLPLASLMVPIPSPSQLHVLLGCYNCCPYTHECRSTYWRVGNLLAKSSNDSVASSINSHQHLEASKFTNPCK